MIVGTLADVPGRPPDAGVPVPLRDSRTAPRRDLAPLAPRLEVMVVLGLGKDGGYLTRVGDLPPEPRRRSAASSDVFHGRGSGPTRAQRRSAGRLR